jgi:hypothetical protein
MLSLLTEGQVRDARVNHAVDLSGQTGDHSTQLLNGRQKKA